MEALIYHFKIVMGETDVPKGEVYHAVEGGNGEFGFYLISPMVEEHHSDYIFVGHVLFTIKLIQK
jgi:NADH:ubiquinone oxidoreductase subunit D